ncbi:MAG: hypothetical protein QG635_1384, partial [Bacteroidota bacterium]|nr:hypothetical protein [Bacteroidota bacterium]
MRYIALFILLLSLLTVDVRTENKNDSIQKIKKEKFREKLSKMPKDSLKKFHAPARKPKKNPKLEEAIKKYNQENPKESQKKSLKPQLQASELPSDFRVPGEFDESQAVLVSWPCYAFDSNMDAVDPLLPGIGVKYYDDNTYDIVPIEGYILDLFDDSPYPPLWGKLVDAIQKECQIWIRVSDVADTTMLKNYMTSHFSPLTNYRFIYNPDGENAFWMRDFGPYGFYYGDDDSVGIVSMEYYADRPIDDAFSEFLADKLGYRFYKSTVETEGGNFMTDGYGHGFYSDVIYYSNADNLGTVFLDNGEINYRMKNPKTRLAVQNEMTKAFNLNETTILPQLMCDGGTGHIDIYLKMVNDETMFVTEYPAVMNNPVFIDYSILNNNFNTLKSLKSTYDRDFKFFRMPLPTSDNGTYSRISCDSFNVDARGYINGLIVNKTFIMPIYSDNFTGNKAGDQAAIDLAKQYLPGYTIVPIDSRELTPLGGAIHCITMQVPAENPLRIWHPSITGARRQKDTIDFIAKLRNRSGINSAICKWRKKGNTNWNSIPLSTSDRENYSVKFPMELLTENDTLEYFLEVSSNNGKTMSKPITAPKGYYTFYIAPGTSVEEYSDDSGFLKFSASPNPFSDYSNIKLNVGKESNIQIALFD